MDLETAVKTLYRYAALAAHPDKGGDHESMKKVNAAHEAAKAAIAARNGGARAARAYKPPYPPAYRSEREERPPSPRCAGCGKVMPQKLAKYAYCWACFAK